MKRIALAATAALALLCAEMLQAQTSRHQPVHATTTRTWHRTTTTRTGQAQWQEGQHQGWNKQVTDTTKARYGGYHRMRPPR